MNKRMLPILVALSLTASAAFYTSGCSTMSGKSTGEYVDDAAITTKAKAALLREGIHVNVTTNKGVVVLNGFVKSFDEKARAEQVARDIAGAQGVQSNLTVTTQTVPYATGAK